MFQKWISLSQHVFHVDWWEALSLIEEALPPGPYDILIPMAEGERWAWSQQELTAPRGQRWGGRAPRLKPDCPVLVPAPCTIARRAKTYKWSLNNLQLHRYYHVRHVVCVPETITDGIKCFLGAPLISQHLLFVVMSHLSMSVRILPSQTWLRMVATWPPHLLASCPHAPTLKARKRRDLTY